MSEKVNLGKKSVTGNLVRDPKRVTPDNGIPLTVLRVIENHRVFDRDQQQWIDGESTGYDVAIGQDRLAKNALDGLKKGDLVTVRGQYSVDSYVTKRGEAGLNHRLWAHDVSISMFNDRLAQQDDISDTSRSVHEVTHDVSRGLSVGDQALQQELVNPSAEAQVGSGGGAWPPPTRAQQREIAQRQERVAESWAAVEQNYGAQHQSRGVSGPSI